MPEPRPLHIGVDGRELLGRPTGVGRYLHALLAEWTAARTPQRVTVFLPAEPPAHLKALDGIAWHTLEAARAGTWWEQTRLPRAARQAAVDVFFAPAYTAPLSMAPPTVLTIHDLSYFAHPEWFGWREGLRRRWLTAQSARRAAAVLTVSEFSAREIEQRLDLPATRIHVIRHGAPAIDRAATPPAERAPMVLFAGSLFARRRIPELIEAFARVAAGRPDARLVLVGDNRATPPIDPVAIAARFNVGDQVHWRRYADDAELTALYRTARVFAFLSDYEGFAMTPLEAIAHGTPAILLDTPVAREIYGDAATLVAATPAAIASAIEQLLTDDRAAAASVDRGYALAHRLSWADAATATMHVLERAAAEGRRG